MKLSIALLVLLTVSCSKLSKHGVMIEVREKITSDDLIDFEEIGDVACKNEIYFVTKAHNWALCIEQMRNEAANLGGYFIYLEAAHELPGFLSTGVELRAKVYAPKENLEK